MFLLETTAEKFLLSSVSKISHRNAQGNVYIYILYMYVHTHTHSVPQTYTHFIHLYLKSEADMLTHPFIGYLKFANIQDAYHQPQRAT
jgi:hypothetical protein